VSTRIEVRRHQPPVLLPFHRELTGARRRRLVLGLDRAVGCHQSVMGAMPEVHGQWGLQNMTYVA
jgi:hypothetical protein